MMVCSWTDVRRWLCPRAARWLLRLKSEPTRVERERRPPVFFPLLSPSQKTQGCRDRLIKSSLDNTYSGFLRYLNVPFQHRIASVSFTLKSQGRCPQTLDPARGLISWSPVTKPHLSSGFFSREIFHCWAFNGIQGEFLVMLTKDLSHSYLFFKAQPKESVQLAFK